MTTYSIYCIASESLQCYQSADVIFKSSLAVDNQLYRQVTDAENTITDFVAVGDMFEVRHLSLHEFRECIDGLTSHERCIGENAVFCFCDTTSNSFVVLFDRASEQVLQRTSQLLHQLDHGRYIGAIIDFLRRTSNAKEAGAYLQNAILSADDPKFPKLATYMLLCSYCDFNARELASFYENAEVKIESEGKNKIVCTGELEKDEIPKFVDAIDRMFEQTKVAFIQRSPERPPKPASEPKTRTSAKRSGVDPQPDHVTQSTLRSSPPNHREALSKRLLPATSEITGAELRALRERMGHSRRDFADLLGVSADRIRRWETRRRLDRIGFSSPKLKQLQAFQLNPGRDTPGWDLVSGKSRKIGNNKRLRFLENKTWIQYFVEFSCAQDVFTFAQVNPFSEAFLDERYKHRLLEFLENWNIGALYRNTPLQSKGPGNPEKPPFEILPIFPAKKEDVTYLVAATNTGETIRIIAFSADYSEWRSDAGNAFKSLFGKGQEIESLGGGSPVTVEFAISSINYLREQRYKGD